MKLMRIIFHQFRSLVWIARYASIIRKIQSSWRKDCPSVISAIVFSKDRAMQLHALLTSFFETKIGACGIVVIYKSSTADHKAAYDEIAKIFGDKITLVEQECYSAFQDCLEQIVYRLPRGKIFFLVDDIVFTEVVDYQFLASLDLSQTVFSLRMGEHLDYSYVIDACQPLPKSLVRTDRYLKWQWSEGRFDWGYPLSVDGHIFSTDEVRLWIKYMKFGSPSSFENSLQKLKLIYRKKNGLSFRKSRIVNIPANKVQDEVNNLHGTAHQDDLLRQWLDGMAIDHQKFRGWVNYSVHQQADFHLIRRAE
jgi:hypothetical protein